jgi:hypothetical protein
VTPGSDGSISRALNGTNFLITWRDPLQRGRQRVPRDRQAVGWGGAAVEVAQDLLRTRGVACSWPLHIST